RFRRSVVCLLPAAHQCADRTGRDNCPAVTLRLHLPSHRLSHVEGPVKINGHRSFKHLGRNVEECVEGADACVACKHIDPTELFHRSVHDALGSARVSNVSFHQVSSSAECCDFCDYCCCGAVGSVLSVVASRIVDDDVGSMSRTFD